jgi:hypothetical protein
MYNLFYSKTQFVELILLLLAILPKHFIVFSSSLLLQNPDAIFVYSDLIPTPAITINSFINPLILCILLLISKGAKASRMANNPPAN